MVVMDRVAELLGAPDIWQDSCGVHWFATGKLQVRDVALRMNEWNANLVTLSATLLPREEGICVDYVWDLEGQLLGFAFYLTECSIASIADLCATAALREIEIRQEMGIEFTGVQQRAEWSR